MLKIILSILFLVSSNLHAAFDYKKDCHHLINDLRNDICLSTNTCQIGRLNLDNIIKESNEITWKVLPKDNNQFVSGSGVTRFDGAHLTEEKLIIVKETELKDLGTRFIFCSHEIFGAIGIDDEEYKLSNSLYLIRQDNSLVDDKKILKNFKNLKRYENNRVFNNTGGGTSVGGGGDLVTIQVRQDLLDYYHSTGEMDKVKKVIDQKISSEIVLGEQKIKYKKGLLGKVKIVLPYMAWQLSIFEDYQDALVKELIEFFDGNYKP